MVDSMVLGTDHSAFDRPRLFSSSAMGTQNGTAPCNLITFLVTIQKLRARFLPVTWQTKDAFIGSGGTSGINQAPFNRDSSLVFKRVAERDKLDEPIGSIYRRLINEVMVLYHPAIRDHPNILGPLGICWDISPRKQQTNSGLGSSNVDQYETWPVFVFEKSGLGDLYQFSSSQDGQDLDIIDRLKICLDIGSALSHMQSNCIIHGDVKPQNILMFIDSQSCFFSAKVVDFGFSTSYDGDNSQIMLGGTQLWLAPEATDYPHFTPAQAMKTDVFSFGMLCLWFMFEKHLSGILPLPHSLQTDGSPWDNEVENPSLRLLWDLKLEGCLTRYATQLVSAEASLSAKSKEALQRFFIGSLECDPQLRDCSIKDALHNLDIQLSYQTAPSLFDPISFPTDDEFNVCYSLPTYFMSDYRVRSAIFQNLEKLVLERPSAALSKQLAFCYELGFGRSDEDLSNPLLKYDEIDAQLQLREAILITHESSNDVSQYPNIVNSQQDILASMYQQSLPILIDHYVEHNLLTVAANIMGDEVKRAAHILGPQHPISIIIKHVLASLMHTQGRLNDAKELTQEIMEVNVRELGKEHVATLITMAELASIYHDQSDFKRAEDLGSEVVAMKKKVLGDEHVLTLESMEHLAVTLEDQNRSVEAEKILIGVIDAKRKTFGREHPRVLSSMGHMALILLNQGRMQDAAKWAHEAMKISKATLGQDDPGNLSIEAVMVKIYICEHRIQDAERLQTELLGRVTRLLGHEHPDRLIHMYNLALIWNNLGRPWDAKDLLTSCAELQVKTLGCEHSSTKESLELLEAWKRDEENWRAKR
ncbi:hypothetical protein F5Y19DRAFT_437112 [Xylariaceae sp. FL1651]|nr:hypothetical protein F5Y19DRAFT_437112 [Xylariaceae sp. FL1651]